MNGIYDPLKAKHMAYVSRQEAKYQGMKIVEDKRLKEFVEISLLAGQSPEGFRKAQIQKRKEYPLHLKREHIPVHKVSVWEENRGEIEKEKETRKEEG